MKVLLVDDDVQIRRALARFFRIVKVECVQGEDGQQAIDLLAQDSSFDCIVSDTVMPKVSGLDLFEHVRHNHPELEPKFFLMSGGMDVRWEARMQQLNMPNKLLSKPMSNEELAAALGIEY